MDFIIMEDISENTAIGENLIDKYGAVTGAKCKLEVLLSIPRLVTN
jgi:hypothetical protein